MGGSISSAIADVMAQGGPEEGRRVARTRGDAGEGDLFAEQAALDDELAVFDQQAVRPPRRAGRPPGSPNRATLKLKQLLLARGYRDPAEMLAATMSMDVRELAAALRPEGPAKTSVTFDQAHEALKLQVRAAEALLPYFHQKMPIAVEHSGERHRPVIIINDASGAAARAERGQVLDGVMSVHESEEDQPLSLSGDAASDDGADASDG